MYIFRFPKAADTLKFTFEGMVEYISKARGPYVVRKVGTTVTLTHFENSAFVAVKLYDTVIAYVYEDRVQVSESVDYNGSQATTAWLQRVLTDNHVGGYVAREKGRYWQAGKTFDISKQAA